MEKKEKKKRAVSPTMIAKACKETGKNSIIWANTWLVSESSRSGWSGKNTDVPYQGRHPLYTL